MCTILSETVNSVFRALVRIASFTKRWPGRFLKVYAKDDGWKVAKLHLSLPLANFRLSFHLLKTESPRVVDADIFPPTFLLGF